MQVRFLVIACALASSLFAQQGAGFRRNATSVPKDPVARRVAMLTRFLDLSATQQTQVTNILTPDVTNLESLQTTLRNERSNVTSAIKSNSGISSAVSAVSATETQIETIRATEAAQIYAILTPDQKTKVGEGLGALYGGGFGMMRHGGPPSKQ